jgi:amidophosphoribosyltransferase
VPNPQIIRGKSIILVDDSIRRGTQLRNLLKEKIMPFEPKEIHGRIASPPQFYPCIYDLATKPCDLATFKSVEEIKPGTNPVADQEGDTFEAMVERIRKRIGFATLHFLTLEEMVKAVIEAPNNNYLKKEDLCLYCWTGCF